MTRFRDPSRGLVVGTAVGYGFPQIEPFVTSLRATGFEGSMLLILARDISADDLAELDWFGVTPHLVQSSGWLACSGHWSARAARTALRTSVGRTPLAARLAMSLLGPANRRWGLYPDVIAASPPLFARSPWVFLTDVRDVHFQANPAEVFAGLCRRSPLHLYAEGEPGADATDGALLIGAQAENANWIRHLGGDDAVDRLRDRQVLCSGTVVLRPETLHELSRRMMPLLAKHRLRCAPDGLDQGALNYLYYTGALDDLDPVVHPNAHGGIFTVGMCSRQSWSLDHDRLVANGETPPVVHQYDRVPQLCTAWSWEGSPRRATTLSLN